MQACTSKKALVIVILVCCLPGPASAQNINISYKDKELPRVFCLNPVKLATSKSRVISGDKSLRPAMESLRTEADEALKAGHFSVMDKKLPPPSGDKHDYMSFGPYWWPDPKKTHGLPYIRRDGQVNPEARTVETDRVALGSMTSAVETLALAWYFTEHQPLAEPAFVKPCKGHPPLPFQNRSSKELTNSVKSC